MQLTGSYSISGRDLGMLLELLRGDAVSGVPGHSAALLRSLSRMAKSDGPSCFFDFFGGAAGIVRSALLRYFLNKKS
jgi:hypothetical protein